MTIPAEELEQVREINRNLPFANPIEQGDYSHRIFFGPTGSINPGAPMLADLANMTDITDCFSEITFNLDDVSEEGDW